MAIALEHRQRIAALTPLEDVVGRIARDVAAAAPRHLAPPDALGAALAQAVIVTSPRPAVALALLDGLPVDSVLTAFAETYAPASLLPVPDEVAAGDPVTPGADAVAPLAAVRWQHGSAELLEAVAPDSGVLLPGTDAAAGEVLWPAGHRLRAGDVAVMQALGIERALVRKPRVAIVRARDGSDAVIDAIATFLTCAVSAAGAEAVKAPAGAGTATGPDDGLATILAGVPGDADAVVVIGGTGAGPRDASVHALRRAGTVAAHGIAISPGETTAFGMASSKPVLAVPGRLDAAMAAWLVIGRPLLHRLAGQPNGPQPGPVAGVLTAKVASTIGMTEVVLVRRDGAAVTALAARYLPLAAIAHGCGFIVLPPGSEGLGAGAAVAVEPLGLP